jgi:KDO2-lipid IV(A) lauroyltransferase
VSPLRRARNRLEAACARGLLHGVAGAPLPLVLGLARLTARGVFLLGGRRRRLAIDNIRHAGLSPDARCARALALESFRAFATMVAETIVARRRLTRDSWADHVALHLPAETEALLRKPGQGLLVASAHLGNWEVAARAISMIKPIVVAYRPFNNPELDAVAHAAREGEHLRLVSRLEAHPLRFMRALAEGDVVALMIDQHATRGRVAIRFFDRTVWATKSVAMLALTTRVPLVFAFAVRTGPLRYEVHATAPMEVTRTGDREQDAAAITQVLTREVERAVRRHPGQYLWSHRRWGRH